VSEPKIRRKIMLETKTVLSTGKLLHSEVTNSAGEDLGKVVGLGIDIEEGRVAYAILSFGGVLGFGDKWHAVPWEALEYSRHDGKFILNVDREMLETAPGFDKDDRPEAQDREFAKQVYQFYDRRPYWEISSS
jgi:sporulation protein YlmC with PRC-barrel domain